jgi:hypothetical protein
MKACQNDFTIGFNAQCVTDETLPNATVGVAYSQMLTSAFGVAPRTFVSAQIPFGLVLDANGLLHGNPTDMGIYHFLVVVTDSKGNHCTDTVNLIINGTFFDQFILQQDPPNESTATGSATGDFITGASVQAQLVGTPEPDGAPPSSGSVTWHGQMRYTGVPALHYTFHFFGTATRHAPAGPQTPVHFGVVVGGFSVFDQFFNNSTPAENFNQTFNVTIPGNQVNALIEFRSVSYGASCFGSGNVWVNIPFPPIHFGNGEITFQIDVTGPF